MPKQSYGTTTKNRARILLLALLDLANDSLEIAAESQLDGLRLHIQTHWQSDQQLVIRTKARYLEALVSLTGQQLSIDQIKTALKHFENWLGILTDNRTAQQGSDNWHFTLTFWGDRWDKATNLQAFDRTWENQRLASAELAIKAPSLAKETAAQHSVPSTTQWSELCRAALDTRLSSNFLTTPIGLSFDIGDVYVPLGLVERPAIASEEESAEASSQFHFLPALLTKWQSQSTVQHIAIIGEPGVGKTTLLQQIALSLLADQLPIWISLADLAGQSIGDYLTKTWLAAAQQTYTVPIAQQEELAQVCQQGRVWLLLDAVDEMGDNPSLALTQLAKQLRGWLANVHIILTCRLNVWDGDKNALADFQTYQSLGFYHQHDQVASFIQHWFQHRPELGTALQLELQRPGLWPLKNTVQNPLCLTLLCRNWTLTQGKLPATKAALYRQFVDALYEWKQDLFPTTLRQRQQLNVALANLAGQAMQQTTVFRLSYQLVYSCFTAIDPDLMTLALQLGWLKSVSISRTGDKVYAFSHPTFQEYFAAQSVDDGQFFVGRFPVIKWQEVVMLWLGREDLADDAKEKLLAALATFDDQAGGFYSYRTYFLAAEGLAEFPHYSRGSQLVAQLVQWRFRSVVPALPTILVERAGMALSRSNRTLTIPALEDFLRVATEPIDRWLAAHSLGKNHDPGNQLAIDTLQALLQAPLSNYFKIDIARSLGTINPGNSWAIKTLTDLIKTESNLALQRRAAQRLGKIDPGNSLVRQTLERLVTEITDPHLQSMTVKALEQLADPAPPAQTRRRPGKTQPQLSHHLAPEQLVEILVSKILTTKDPLGQIRMARRIAQLDLSHPQGLGHLLICFAASTIKVEIKLICESLRELVTIHDSHMNIQKQVPHIFTTVRDAYLAPTNSVQYQESFKLLWYWSRQLSYQEFSQLWYETMLGHDKDLH
jgi:hypothetical protein